MKIIMRYLIVGIMISMTLLGCENIRENYDKISVGMDYSEVVAILGEPDNTSDTLGAKKCVWGTESENITIRFLADKVIVHSMSGL